MVADLEGHLVTSTSVGRLAPAAERTDKGEGLNRSGRSWESERQELAGSLVVQSGAMAKRTGVALCSSQGRAVWCREGLNSSLSVQSGAS